MCRVTYRTIIAPQRDQLSEISEGLRAFGLEQTGGEEPDQVAIVCECAERVVGGAVGHSLRGRFYLTQVWVAADHRSKGLGSALVAHTESVARERACSDIVLDTLNRDAVAFYERLGYRVYMVNDGYIRGFDWFFLCKPLVPTG